MRTTTSGYIDAVDLSCEGADIFTNSQTGGAYTMTTNHEDLAELRVSAPPLSGRR
jgi:hypothetical protein